MSIQDWGAIGEILGAAAILVTLIYLANQIKYARLTAMDTNRRSCIQATAYRYRCNPGPELR